MENDILDCLNDLGYEGPLSDEVAFLKAVEGGPKSLEFTKLVHVLSEELKRLCNLEETINIINDPDESVSFLLELSSFLKELGCPYKQLVIGHMSSRLQTKEDRLLLLDYLISELMAARIVAVDHPKEKQGSNMEIVMQESPTAKDLKEILIALKFNKPPPNITAEVLFSKLEAKLKDTIQKEGDQLVGKPLYNKALTEKDWKQLETTFTEMFEEYRLRRETLITRLECTIQSFEWSDRLKNKKDHIQSAYRPKREQLKVKPDVKLSDFLAARTALLQVEKTSSASVRKNTQSDVNKVIIGQLKRIEDNRPEPYVEWCKHPTKKKKKKKINRSLSSDCSPSIITDNLNLKEFSESNQNKTGSSIKRQISGLSCTSLTTASLPIPLPSYPEERVTIKRMSKKSRRRAKRKMQEELKQKESQQNFHACQEPKSPQFLQNKEIIPQLEELLIHANQFNVPEYNQNGHNKFEIDMEMLEELDHEQTQQMGTCKEKEEPESKRTKMSGQILDGDDQSKEKTRSENLAQSEREKVLNIQQPQNLLQHEPKSQRPAKRTLLTGPISSEMRPKLPRLDLSQFSPSNEKNLTGLHVAITTASFTVLRERELTKIKKLVEKDLLNQILDPFSKIVPGFKGKPLLTDGSLKLWCKDEETKIWLSNMIAMYPPTSNGEKLILARQTELPKLIRCGVFLPERSGTLSDKHLMLIRANEWARIDTWVFYKAHRRRNGIFVTVGIPLHIIPVLERNNRQLFFSLGTVYVQILESTGRINNYVPTTAEDQPLDTQVPGPSRIIINSLKLWKDVELDKHKFDFVRTSTSAIKEIASDHQDLGKKKSSESIPTNFDRSSLHDSAQTEEI